MVSLAGVLRGTALTNLRSGHSHEDIDQMFGSLASWLVKHGKQVETPADLLLIVQAFLEQLQRPHEKMRRVFHVDQARDWYFGRSLMTKSACPTEQG